MAKRKEPTMKRTLLITAAVLLIAAGPASAGLCIDTDSSCNDVYVEFEPIQPPFAAARQ